MNLCHPWPASERALASLFWLAERLFRVAADGFAFRPFIIRAAVNASVTAILMLSFTAFVNANCVC